MNIDQELRAEYDRESALTRKMIDAIPADADLTWKADPKSMTLGRLAGHVAEAAGRWGIATLTEDGIDLSGADFKPFQPATKAEILTKFDVDTAHVQRTLAGFDPAKWDEPWTLGRVAAPSSPIRAIASSAPGYSITSFITGRSWAGIFAPWALASPACMAPRRRELGKPCDAGG